jgi:hypothetical protein
MHVGAAHRHHQCPMDSLSLMHVNTAHAHTHSRTAEWDSHACGVNSRAQTTSPSRVATMKPPTSIATSVVAVDSPLHFPHSPEQGVVVAAVAVASLKPRCRCPTMDLVTCVALVGIGETVLVTCVELVGIGETVGTWGWTAVTRRIRLRRCRRLVKLARTSRGMLPCREQGRPDQRRLVRRGSASVSCSSMACS